MFVKIDNEIYINLDSIEALSPLAVGSTGYALGLTSGFIFHITDNAAAHILTFLEVNEMLLTTPNVVPFNLSTSSQIALLLKDNPNGLTLSMIKDAINGSDNDIVIALRQLIAENVIIAVNNVYHHRATPTPLDKTVISDEVSW